VILAVDGFAVMVAGPQWVHRAAAPTETTDDFATALHGHAPHRRRFRTSVCHLVPPPLGYYWAAIKSEREKKKASSFSAFSGESLPWIALASIDVPKRARIVPGSALATSVAPITWRR